jgi:hypothetical protein
MTIFVLTNFQNIFFSRNFILHLFYFLKISAYTVHWSLSKSSIFVTRFRHFIRAHGEEFFSCCVLNPILTCYGRKVIFYLKIQFVLRSKHSLSRLQKKKKQSVSAVWGKSGCLFRVTNTEDINTYCGHRM